LKGVLVI